MAYTSPATRAAGYVVGSTQWNELVMNDRWANQADTDGRPICIAYRSTNQTIANSTITLVTWNAEVIDNAGMHSTSSNTGRFTAPIDGYYRCESNLVWASSAAGNRENYALFNGTGNNYGDSKVPNVGATAMGQPNAVPLFAMTAGQFIEVFCAQSSGGNLDLVGTASYPRCVFSIVWERAL